MASLDTPRQFNFGERLGIFIIVEAASLSAASTGFLLLYIIYNSLRRARRISSRTNGFGQRHDHEHGKEIIAMDNDDEETETPKDVSGSTYFINLMIAEFIQSVGGLLNVKWLIDALITEGTLCTAQGAFKQIGDVAVALTTSTIAIHTFLVLVLRWHVTPRISFGFFSVATPLFVVSLIWIFIALVVGISAGAHGQGYYGDTDYWCWIKSDYSKERLGLEYVWMWIAAFLQIIIYVFLALVFRGIIVVEKGSITFGKKGSKPNRLGEDAYNDTDSTFSADNARTNNAIATQMLFYPLVYVVAVFPVAVVRWLAFSGGSVPPGATFFASVLFSLSGFANVVLYSITRPGVVHGSSPSQPMEREDSSMVITSELSHTKATLASAGVSRRRTGSLMSATGQSVRSAAAPPPGPRQRELGRLPDLDDEGYFTPIPEHEYEHHGSGGHTQGHSGSTVGPGYGQTRTAPEQREHMGRLPDSDDEQ